MSPRPYHMNRRATSASDTRHRIVEATAALHAEKGVAATTFRDIAARADVGLGTVYHHFPTYDHVITACGQYSMAAAQPPQTSAFASLRSPVARVRTMVRELCGFYSRIPVLGRIRSERNAFAPLDAAFRHEEEQRRALIDEALRGVRAGPRVRALAFSVLDFSVYESLVSAGLSHDVVVDELATVILNRLNLRSTR
ncbi:MAG TPA: TetR/AcrR family transcriptional regulator [Thermoanaerobaculia bacterium]|nr:TetR/AcrR family transcriptional regulator [Thermoanaerobaculia bacterium]